MRFFGRKQSSYEMFAREGSSSDLARFYASSSEDAPLRKHCSCSAQIDSSAAPRLSPVSPMDPVVSHSLASHSQAFAEDASGAQHSAPMSPLAAATSQRQSEPSPAELREAERVKREQRLACLTKELAGEVSEEGAAVLLESTRAVMLSIRAPGALTTPPVPATPTTEAMKPPHEVAPIAAGIPIEGRTAAAAPPTTTLPALPQAAPLRAPPAAPPTQESLQQPDAATDAAKDAKGAAAAPTPPPSKSFLCDLTPFVGKWGIAHEEGKAAYMNALDMSYVVRKAAKVAPTPPIRFTLDAQRTTLTSSQGPVLGKMITSTHPLTVTTTETKSSQLGTQRITSQWEDEAGCAVLYCRTTTVGKEDVCDQRSRILTDAQGRPKQLVIETRLTKAPGAPTVVYTRTYEPHVGK